MLSRVRALVGAAFVLIAAVLVARDREEQPRRAAATSPPRSPSESSRASTPRTVGPSGASSPSSSRTWWASRAPPTRWRPRIDREALGTALAIQTWIGIPGWVGFLLAEPLARKRWPDSRLLAHGTVQFFTQGGSELRAPESL
jgi:hypothetical protein